MSSAPYRLLDADPRPTLGLIVLRTDETVEEELRRYIPDTAARLFITRIPSGEDVTPESLREMKGNMTAASALFPPSVKFDAVGYACTSGAAHVGAETVAQMVCAGSKARSVTDPMTAAVSVMRAGGLERISLMSPYIADVADTLRGTFEAHGFKVPDTVSFDEAQEALVARIDPASIKDAARELAKRTPCDGIFISCTNLRTIDILDELEVELGLPVFASNQVLARHMMDLATQ